MADRVTVDFDHHSPAYATAPSATAAHLSAQCPVAWTEHHGGYWVVSGYKEVEAAARDTATFSSRHDLPDGSSPFRGVNLPPTPSRYLPIELDPPTHILWRQAMGASFSPAAVERMRPLMEEYCTWAIDQSIESGGIDFVLGLGAPVPTLLTLHLLGLPLSRWQTYAEMTHRVNYAAGADRIVAFQLWDEMLAEIGEFAEMRRSNPQADLLTVLAQMRVDNEPLSTSEIVSACSTIVAGGIDTTAAVVASALKHLGEDRALRERLSKDHTLIPAAVDEFIRHVSPVTGLGRTAARDVELGGQRIAAGDRVLLAFHAANMDEKAFPQPCAVDITRDGSKHIAFGHGPHRCIGQGIARADIPIMLEQVLERMPDYELVPDSAVRYPSIGVSNNYISVPARFSPGPRRGVRAELLAEIAG